MLIKQHADTNPHRVTIVKAEHRDGYASIGYRFCLDITGDVVVGWDYVTETRRTKIPIGKVDIPTLRLSILAEYAEVWEQWEAQRNVREMVESYLGAVLLD